MKDKVISPSRLLFVTAAIARWALGMVLAAWLVFALVIAVLHGWIVPRIDQYRGALEAQATRVIGVPVRIASIAAVRGGRFSLFPSFELRDVVLHDAQQREALRLARVVVNVSPRSLWNLSFEQLYIERPELDVRVDVQGRLYVAGIEVKTEASGDSRAADWLFSQRELAVMGGTVRWTDERRSAPPLQLTDAQFIVRKNGRRHSLRLDVMPPPEWGGRMSVRGDFRQPLLTRHSGRWQDWSGQWYAELSQLDVSRLGSYVALDARIRAGRGSLRAWADVRAGAIEGVTADLNLDTIDVTLAKNLQPLVLQGVTGRLAGSLRKGVLELSTQQLQFSTPMGAGGGGRWPGGNLWLRHTPAAGSQAEQGALRADQLDLGMIVAIADGLPLGDALHQALAVHAPRGRIEHIELSWSGAIDAPQRYTARGRMSQLALASQPHPHVHVEAKAAELEAVGLPGVRGARIEFDASQAGGSATLGIEQGALELPGVFEEPVLPFDQLSAQVQWTLDGPRAQVQVSKLRFANADAQGEATASWKTSDPATSSGRGYFPGVIDLQGKLTRADGTRVYRYLPLSVVKTARDYVRDAVRAGRSNDVDFRVRGDLHDMPFDDPRRGEFRVAAKVSDAVYAYVPHAPGGPQAPSPWPALTDASAELIFVGPGMSVRQARAKLQDAPGLELVEGSADIPDFRRHESELKVDARAKGPLGDAVRIAATLVGSDALSRARAVGNADYQLHMEMPLHQINKTRVQAGVTLTDNELQVQPDLPTFTQLRGVFSFTEGGFTLSNVRTRLAGGDTRIEGRGRYGVGAPALGEMSFHAQGSVSAEGLRAVRSLDWLARLGHAMSGSTNYTADLSLRNGMPEFSATSSLQGMALQLPEPLVKAAGDTLALHLEKKVLSATQDSIGFDLGSIASARYLRDVSGAQARVLAGGWGVGLTRGESVVVPAQGGVLVHVDLPRLDVDAWSALIGDAFGAAVGGHAGGSADDGASHEDASDYLPTQLAVHAQEVRVAGRKVANVVLGGTRDGKVWRFNVDSDELGGYAEYRDLQGGRLLARLARLKLGPSESTQVESLLDQRSSSLPALDIVIDNFEMNGKRLGRAEIEAVNQGDAAREWRLNRLHLSAPDFNFAAQGSWAAVPGGGARRMALQFTLGIQDAGALLNRLGMKDVLRHGQGKLEGRVAWRGSPFGIDYPSLDGQLNLNIQSGQFLKADPGLAKLLGVLSLQALPRRLSLDFRDVFSEGFAFDFVRGDARIAHGVASTNNFQMKGVAAGVLLEGSADVVRETQELRVIVVPELNTGTAALVLTAINPAVGLGTFLAQWALKKPLTAAATQEFHITGTWADPKTTKVERQAGAAEPVFGEAAPAAPQASPQDTEKHP